MSRYANVIAYDHSRVVLQPVDGVVGSDYLNANYCDGYRKQNAYIATQVNRLETPPSFAATGHCRVRCPRRWPTTGGWCGSSGAPPS